MNKYIRTYTIVEPLLVKDKLEVNKEYIAFFIPELALQFNYDQDSPYHDFDLWTHTFKVVCAVPRANINLMWAALLHDIAKPWSRSKNKKGYSNYINHEQFGAYMAEVILKRLGMPHFRIDYICDVIKHHLEDGNALKPYDDMSKKLVK